MSSNKEETKSNNKAGEAHRKVNKKNKGNNNVGLQSQLDKIAQQLQALKKPYGLKTPQIAVNKFYNDKNLQNEVHRITGEMKPKGKLRKLEALVGEKFVHELVPKFGSKSFQEKCGLCASVYADDFSSALGMTKGGMQGFLMSLAMEYGPEIIDWLYSKAEKAYVEIAGHGSGTGLVTTSMPIMGFGSHQMTDTNTVDLTYLASVFCPEKWNTITPDSFSNQIVSSAKEEVFALTTGTDGNCIFYYLPDAVTQAGTSVASWATATNGPAATNLVTGVPSTYVLGPGSYFSATSSNIARYRSSTGSIRIVPQLAAVNNSGSLTLAYFTESPINNTYGVSNPVLTQDQVLQAPFLHICAINGTKEIRQIHIPHDVLELGLDDFATLLASLASNGGLDQLYFNVSGGPVSSVVAKAYITNGIDYALGSTLAGLIKQGPSPDAPGSLPCVATLLKRFPHLAQLTLDEAIGFGEKILNIGSDRYSEVVSRIIQIATGFKTRPKKSLGFSGGGGQGNIDEVSMDIIKMSDM
jgi:hypothetical protein